MISGHRQEAGAPPFIGLIPLDEAARERAIERTRQFLDGRPDRLKGLFRQFPNLAAWLVTHSLSEGYGDANRAVYRHIVDTLRLPLDTQQQRKVLFSSFCSVCDRFGLPTRGFDRDIDVYLLHAGVSQAQLPHLIDAFLRQEAAFGPPPVETTVLLNRWEDDALYFLPPAVNVLRRAILWDETAWHAALFARIQKPLSPRSSSRGISRKSMTGDRRKRGQHRTEEEARRLHRDRGSIGSLVGLY